jgi:hypothetical protein
MYYDKIRIYDGNTMLVAELPQSKKSQMDAEFIVLAKNLSKKLKGDKK